MKWYELWRVFREPAYAAIAWAIGYAIGRWSGYAPVEFAGILSMVQIAARRVYRDNVDLTGKRLNFYLQKLYDSGFRVPPAR
jgi:hypothetical protein